MEQTEKKRNTGMRGLLRGTSVFWQYFVLLLAMLLLALAMLYASGARYTQILTETYLQQREISFRRDCESFSATLYSTYSVPAAIQSTADYDNLRRAANGQYPESSKPIVLSALRTSLRTTMALIRNGECAECFLYFPVADAVCTQTRAFEDAAACFDGYLRYEDRTADELLTELRSTSLIRLLPEENVSIGGSETPCLTLLHHPAGTAPVMGVLYPREAVLRAFRMDTLPDDAYLCLTDGSGTVLLTCGDPESADRYEFTCNLTGVRGQATLGVPKDYFTTLVAPARRYSLILLGAMLLIGLALCFAMALVGTMPLRRLLKRFGLPNESSQRNEIRRLADLLANSRIETDEIHRLLSSSVLARMFTGGLLSPAEEEKLLKAYPMLSGPCRIAIVHSATALEEFGQADVTELLREHLPEQFACGTINALETGILLPDDEQNLHELAMVLSGVNSQLRVDGLTVLCGVSAPFTGVPSVYAAVRQAQFSIPIRESSYIEVFSAEETGEDRPGVYSWLTHERLYQAVIKNDRTDTLEFVRSLGADRYAPGAAKEVFYNVRFVIRSTANELELPLPEADALEYHEEMRPKENFRRMEDLVTTLFDRLAARQETDAENVQENVVAYIGANFRDPDLNAQTLATHFSLPLKTVYAAVRDRTSMNLGDYLVSVRMKEAAKLLCTTQRSVDEIAVACGYPAQSTFYRVFRKYYGESPNRYRSLH
ncbi:MAG: helix-turn-helix transcriptional regulator [Oscillospiraceae bacterium]|nr:helix-turn-helix transcriptional regulator [Oscillospiraceae bacterium]